MNRKAGETGLGAFHPLVSFLYFFCVIGFSLLFAHPVYAGIGLVFAFLHAYQLAGQKAVRTLLVAGLPLFIIITLANPLFNHRGSTVLFYLRYNPITLESFLFGLVTAAMMVGTITWFFCYNEVITSDKFLYIFGRVVPTVGLIAAMTLRLIPKLMGQAGVIAEGQRCLGMGFTGGPMKRARTGARILSILVTWALEDAVITVDSMKARGYGTGRRSHFSRYTFTRKDKLLLCSIVILAALSIAAYALGIGKLRFYPRLAGLRLDGVAVVFYGFFLLFCALPILLKAREDFYWNSLR